MQEVYYNIVYLRDNRHKPHDPDEVLHFGYKVDGVWISDMLRRGRPQVEGTVADARFGPLTVLQCHNKTFWGADEAVRLWLSPRLGWMAVKTETEYTDIRPTFKVRVVYEVRSVVRSSPLWTVSEGHLRYGAVALGRWQEIGDHPQRFTDVVFNDVADSQFAVHYAVGTHVLSEDFQKTSVLQPSGQWREEPSELIPSAGPQWPVVLAGVVLAGGAGFALVRARRRGKRQTA